MHPLIWVCVFEGILLGCFPVQSPLVDHGSLRQLEEHQDRLPVPQRGLSGPLHPRRRPLLGRGVARLFFWSWCPFSWLSSEDLRKADTPAPGQSALQGYTGRINRIAVDSPKNETGEGARVASTGFCAYGFVEGPDPTLDQSAASCHQTSMTRAHIEHTE